MKSDNTPPGYRRFIVIGGRGSGVIRVERRTRRQWRRWMRRRWWTE